ncbi:hypothetical protein [Dysgonomonas sp.]
MSETPKPIPISKLKESALSGDMWIIVSKQENGKWKSYRVPLDEVKCKCDNTPESPEPEPKHEPDKYEDLPKNKRDVFHVMTVRGYFGDYQLKSGLSELDYDSYSVNNKDREDIAGYYESTNKSPYIGAVGTYPVIDVDEISLFAAPMRTHTGINTHGSLCNGLDVQRSDIARITGITDSDNMIKDWDSLIGGYYAWGHSEIRGIFFPRNFQIYDKREGADRKLLEGWDVIMTDQFLQVIGQAPQNGGDMFDNIRDFLFISKEEDIYNTNSYWNTGKNISGLNFYAAGDVQNSGSHTLRPCNVRAFGTCLAMTTKRVNGDQVYLTRFETSPQQLREIGSTRAFAHGGNLRYARTKTPEELGYKLVIDSQNDKILFTSPDDERLNIPVGCLRGVALRYANRKEKVITKSYTDIVAEAAHISALFSINADIH